MKTLGCLLLACFLASHFGAAVRQPSPAMHITRIAFGSCSFQSVPQPIFRAVVASRPDLYMSGPAVERW